MGYAQDTAKVMETQQSIFEGRGETHGIVKIVAKISQEGLTLETDTSASFSNSEQVFLQQWNRLQLFQLSRDEVLG